MDYLAQTSAKYQAVVGDQADQLALELLNRQMHLQALTLTFNDILKMLAALMFATAFIVFLVKKPSNAPIDNMPVH
jgi:DHA2 family multidrug resistance protein